MPTTIHVDKDELDAQTANLAAILQDDSLKNYCEQSIVPILQQSSGDHIRLITNLNTELNETVEQFYLLMSRTYDFLTNAGTAFIQADEGLAERIRSGEFY